MSDLICPNSDCRSETDEILECPEGHQFCKGCARKGLFTFLSAGEAGWDCPICAEEGYTHCPNCDSRVESEQVHYCNRCAKHYCYQCGESRPFDDPLCPECRGQSGGCAGGDDPQRPFLSTTESIPDSGGGGGGGGGPDSSPTDDWDTSSDESDNSDNDEAVALICGILILLEIILALACAKYRGIWPFGPWPPTQLQATEQVDRSVSIDQGQMDESPVAPLVPDTVESPEPPVEADPPDESGGKEITPEVELITV